MNALEHFIKALDLGHLSQDGLVSLEEARHLLAANDDTDSVCMTQEQRHRVLTTLISLLEGKSQ